MRWTVELAMRAGPALTVALVGLVVAAEVVALRRIVRLRLNARLTTARRSLGQPTRDPFATPDVPVTLDGDYGRDESADGAWLTVGARRVTLAQPRRLLVGTAEPWRPDARRSLARGARVRARGVLRHADDDVWSLDPDGDVVTLAALAPTRLRDAPYAAWSLAVVATIALLAALVTARGHGALATLDAAPRPVAMTAHGVLWESRWTPAQRAQLALANVSPWHHRAAQRIVRDGLAREERVPWLDPPALERLRDAVLATRDCGLAAEFFRRTGTAPPDDGCELRARIEAHPLTVALRAETRRSAAVPDASFACLAHDASNLRAHLADATLPFLLRDTVVCVRDAAAACGPTGCPASVTEDLAALVIEHHIALRATTHGREIRPVWWRRPSVLRSNLRRLATAAATLAIDTLDARFARGDDWPQAFTWGSAVETMRAFPSVTRAYRPIVAHFPGVGVEPAELANPWATPELHAASANARLAALVEWWRLGEYVPAREAPARERSALVQRAVALANGRRAGPVLALLGDPTLESVEALAVVAYRLTEERAQADAWLRGAPGFLPPEAGDHAARCRLRTALRQAAQRLRRTELLAATPWAALGARACASAEADVPTPEAPTE